MDGGPSHVDTFDYKPKLTADDGKPRRAAAAGSAGGKLLGSPFKFKQHGKSGLYISEVFPELAKQADELCLAQRDVLRPAEPPAGVHPDALRHLPVPAAEHGAWVVYGLGTENANLPGFVTLSPSGGNGGPVNYGSSFLRPCTRARGSAAAGRRRPPAARQQVRNLKNPKQTAAAAARRTRLPPGLNQNALEQPAARNPASRG